MILADTAIWIDHFRRKDLRLSELLDAGLIVIHPFIIGELALGQLRQRDQILPLLESLPVIASASQNEVLAFITSHRLYGQGLGLIDVHLLASLHLQPGSRLWTRDRRLANAAKAMGLAADEASSV